MMSVTTTLDVRVIPIPRKHPTIFKTFEELKPGESFILVNDHDPKPLYYQFAAERAGQFEWTYLEKGPEVWRVEIGKPAAKGGCCHGHQTQSPTEVLKAEHRVIERGIALLEKAAMATAAGTPPPKQTLENLVLFLRTFADKCHHGKEEGILFPALVEKGVPKEGGPVGVMLIEHDEGRSFIRGLSESIADLGQKADAPARIVQNAARYAQLLRQHIQKEDNVLFAIADSQLDEAEQKAMFERFERFEEEDTGTGEHERMLKLLDQTEAALGAPSATRGGCGHHG